MKFTTGQATAALSGGILATAMAVVRDFQDEQLKLIGTISVGVLFVVLVLFAKRSDPSK